MCHQHKYHLGQLMSPLLCRPPEIGPCYTSPMAKKIALEGKIDALVSIVEKASQPSLATSLASMSASMDWRPKDRSSPYNRK
jgi:hypothetical protein